VEVRFADHASFQRAAGCFLIGGGALGMTGSLPLAAAGSALALLLARRARAPFVICAVAGCAAFALPWLAAPPAWTAAGCGAILALVLTRAGASAAKERGVPLPSPVVIGLTVLAEIGAVALAFALLPQLTLVLRAALPGWMAGAASGGALGVWTAVAALPLHLQFGADRIEDRLPALRLTLGPELRGLVERAVAARRGAAREIPDGACAELRGLIDSLTAAALDLAARAQDLSRAAAPETGDELQRRAALLQNAAGEAADPAARQSYLRAADALSAQLDHFQRVHRARERTVARLHEEVANLERARFSLTLIKGPDGAAGLALLQERLKAGATVFEETDAVSVPAPEARA
jgi:hypothetical protein